MTRLVVMALLLVSGVLAAYGAGAPVLRFADYPGVIRVACVGDSITYGLNIEDREQCGYPAVLGRLLGKPCEVRNFGVSGATLLKKGWHPYWKLAEYADATAWQPDVVLIMLGTNDANPRNWQYKDEFAPNLREFLDHFTGLPGKPRVWVCLPVPIYGGGEFAIAGGNLQREVEPLISAVAAEKGVPVIDLFTAMSNHPEFFPDNLHPNAPGAAVMAQTIFQTITGLPVSPTFTPDGASFFNTLQVSITSHMPDAELRYSLGVKARRARWQAYAEPITVRDTTVIQAAMFQDKKMLGPITTATFTRAPLHPAVPAVATEKGLSYAYYEDTPAALQQLDVLTPVASGVTDTITLKPRKRNDAYAFRFTGFLTVPQDGLYTFHLAATGSAQLTINQTGVAMKRRSPSPDSVSGVVALAAGLHAFSLCYAQTDGLSAIKVQYEGPGLVRQDLPAAALSHAKAP